MARLFVLFVALLAVAPVPARAAGAVLVMNSNEATLSVLDLAHPRELGRIPVLRQPHHWALTPDGRDLLVGDTLGNALFVLDPATFAVRQQIPMSDPYQLGFSPNGKFLVVNGLSRAQVDVYEPGTYRLIRRFPLRSMPSHLAFAPDSSAVFVSLQGTGMLAAIDLRKMEVAWEKPVGNTPAGVLWLNGHVLVANMGSADVAVVDPADGRVERQVHTGKGAHQIYLSPDGKRLYVNNRLDYHSVTVLDPVSFAVLRRYVVLGGPDDLAFAPNGDIWLTLRLANKVAVLDPASGAVEEIPVGRAPHGIFINPEATIPAAMAAR